MTVKDFFHTVTSGDLTLYCDSVEFENKNYINRIYLANGEIYSSVTKADTQKIIIKGHFFKEDKALVNSFINSLSGKISGVEIDGTTFDKVTSEESFVKLDKENILGEFEIRLVNGDE